MLIRKSKRQFLFIITTRDENIGVLTREEFEQLFDLHYKQLRNFLYYKTSQVELSEDVAQDAFVKLWETRKKINKSTVKAYLFTIANNLAINRLKNKQLRFKFLKYQEQRSDIQTPQYLMEMEEFDLKLQAALSKIPDGAREAFLMNRIDGIKYREIAEMLNISMKAVEKRISTALAVLRAEIEEKI